MELSAVSLRGVPPSQVQDWALVPVEFHRVPVGPFLPPVPLNISPALESIRCSPDTTTDLVLRASWMRVASMASFLQVVDEDVKEDRSQDRSQEYSACCLQVEYDP